MRISMTACALLPAILVGCAQHADVAGFASVESLAHQRTGQFVRWDRNSSGNQAIAGEVDLALQTELPADSAVRIALLNNRSLQATYEQLGIAQADVVQAGLMKNPVLFMQFRFPDRSPKITNLEFSIAEDFLDALLIPARKRLAAAQFEATKSRVGGAILNLAADVRAAYFSLAGAEQMLELHRAAFSAVEASSEAAQKLREAGNISDLDLLSYRAQYDQQQLALAQAEADVIDAREALVALLGLDDASALKIASGLPEIPVNDPSPRELQQTAIAQRTDLAAAKTSIEVAARAGGLVRSARYVSNLEFGVDAERDTDGQWVVGPTFAIPIPLLDQGQAAVAKAQAQVRQAEQNYAAMKTQIRSDVRRACARLGAARIRVLMYRDTIIPLRGRIVEQSQLFYNGMLLGVFDLLRAKEDELSAHRQYIGAVRDYWVEYSQLERIVGGRLPVETAPATMPATMPEHEHHHHGD